MDAVAEAPVAEAAGEGREEAGLQRAEDDPIQQLESMCMRCQQNGTTTIYLTRIPHFRETLIMSFECPHCGERNCEAQSAGRVEPRGATYTLTVPKGDRQALNRQVVKSDTATVRVPELDFEIPQQAQRGSLTTVEGLLTRAAEELRALQEERHKVDPATAGKLDEFLTRLDEVAAGDRPFTVILDDPAGNSFLENPNAPKADPHLKVEYYERTIEQNVAIGCMSEEAAAAALAQQEQEQHPPPVEPPTTTGRDAAGASSHAGGYVKAGTRWVPGMTPPSHPHGSVGGHGAQKIAEGASEAVSQSLLKYSAPEEVMTFPSTCSLCNAPCETRMYVTNIPYFKEVIVMASTCDACGYRNSEIKPGGGTSEKGKKVTLKVRTAEDLKRDVIKSESAAVFVPEAELELAPGTLGGKVTTVEGLMEDVSEKLLALHSFSIGDSALGVAKERWGEFEARLRRLIELREEWTLVLDDPLANSFIAPATDSFEDDPQLSSEEFERTFEQNEELGINDMDTAEADKAYEQADEAAESAQ